MNSKTFTLIFLFLIAVISCKKETNEDYLHKLNLRVEIKDNIPYLIWDKVDTGGFELYSIRRSIAYSSTSILDTFSSISAREFMDNYSNLEEYEFHIDSVNINTFKDSSVLLSNYIFYSVDARYNFQHADKNKWSDYIRLKVPNVQPLSAKPTNLLFDNDLNYLYILDFTNEVKLLLYNINEKVISKNFNFGYPGNFTPSHDMYIETFNGEKKLFLSLKNEIYMFNTTTLQLENHFNTGEYLETSTFDKIKFIFAVDHDGGIYSINVNTGNITKVINGNPFSVANWDAKILDSNLYIFTQGTVDKYSILPSGNLTFLDSAAFVWNYDHKVILDNSSKLFILSNGLIINSNLDIERKLDFPDSFEFISILHDIVCYSNSDSKVVYLYNFKNGQQENKYFTLSYPFGVFLKQNSLLSIEKYSDMACLEEIILKQ